MEYAKTKNIIMNILELNKVMLCNCSEFVITFVPATSIYLHLLLTIGSTVHTYTVIKLIL